MEKDKQIETKKTNRVARTSEKGLLEIAFNYIKSNDIKLPANFDVAGAVNGFYLRLLDTIDSNKKPALDVCTPKSIEKALRDMIASGLDLRKKQAYLIVYGNQLKLQESYFGNQKKARTYDLRLSDFRAQVVYKGDEYETKIEPDGRKTLVKHIQKNGVERTIDNIEYAYSIVLVDGLPDLEDMTKGEILNAWAKSRTSGATHKEFPADMAKKTVINRHAKRYINTSDDSSLFYDDNGGYKNLNISGEVIDMSTPIQATATEEIEPETEDANDFLPEADGFDDLPLVKDAK